MILHTLYLAITFRKEDVLTIKCPTLHFHWRLYIHLFSFVLESKCPGRQRSIHLHITMQCHVLCGIHCIKAGRQTDDGQNFMSPVSAYLSRWYRAVSKFLSYKHQYSTDHSILNNYVTIFSIQDFWTASKCVFKLCSMNTYYLILPVLSVSMLHPLMSESFSEFTYDVLWGTRDQELGIRDCTSNLGGHAGTALFGPRNTAADSGNAFWQTLE